MFVPWSVINHFHPITAFCVRGDDRNRQWLTEEEAQVAVVMELRVYGQPLEKVKSFKYPRCLLNEMDND